MSGDRNKPKTITDLQSLGEDMSEISKISSNTTAAVHTGGEHYRLLRNLHLRLSEATLKISGQHELPWVAWSRGGILAVT
jgi:hypothetical protein